MLIGRMQAVVSGLKAQLHLAQGITLGPKGSHTPGALKGQLLPAQGNTLGSKDGTLGNRRTHLPSAL